MFMLRDVYKYSALIAVQAGVDRREMAVVTSFRKYVNTNDLRKTVQSANLTL